MTNNKSTVSHKVYPSIDHVKVYFESRLSKGPIPKDDSKVRQELNSSCNLGDLATISPAINTRSMMVNPKVYHAKIFHLEVDPVHKASNMLYSEPMELTLSTIPFANGTFSDAYYALVEGVPYGFVAKSSRAKPKGSLIDLVLDAHQGTMCQALLDAFNNGLEKAAARVSMTLPQAKKGIFLLTFAVQIGEGK